MNIVPFLIFSNYFFIVNYEKSLQNPKNIYSNAKEDNWSILPSWSVQIEDKSFFFLKLFTADYHRQITSIWYRILLTWKISRSHMLFSASVYTAYSHAPNVVYMFSYRTCCDILNRCCLSGWNWILGQLHRKFSIFPQSLTAKVFK